MDGDDALPDEMRRLPGPRPADPPPLDRETVERMLAGAVHPADAPPGYAGVVEVLAAAAARPSPAELAGEAEAVAAFRAARRSLDPSRRKPVLGKVVSAKVLAAIAAGTISVGTAAAAATGSLPGPAQDVADRVLHGSQAAESTHGAAARESSAALPGAAGLCRAWSAGKGGENGKKLDATAFGRLAEAAGGADKVPTYCAGLAGATNTATQRTAHAPQVPDATLMGMCRAWLTADKRGHTDQLSKAVRDRLATAAGDAAKVTSFCAAMVTAAAEQPPAPGASHGAPTSPTPTGAGGHGRPSTSPPTPRG